MMTCQLIMSRHVDMDVHTSHDTVIPVLKIIRQWQCKLCQNCSTNRSLHRFGSWYPQLVCMCVHVSFYVCVVCVCQCSCWDFKSKWPMHGCMYVLAMSICTYWLLYVRTYYNMCAVDKNIRYFTAVAQSLLLLCLCLQGKQNFFQDSAQLLVQQLH